MSLRERSGALAAAAVLALVLAGASACTVRPLYMAEAPAAAGGTSVRADLEAIGIKPATTRAAQEVRNHLVFLLHGGKGEPASPRYSLSLTVSSLRQTTVTAPATTIDDVNVPTAQTITMTATYQLTESAGGKPVASGRRSVSASLDVPRQQYAAWRAETDAQSRAARELAQQIQLALAQDLSRR